MADGGEILSAIEKGELVLGLDPLHYAVITKTNLANINPLLWAIQNKKTIDDKDPLLFALQYQGFDINQDVLKEAASQGHIITIGNNNYSIDEFKDRVIESIKEKKTFEGLKTEDLIKITINGNFAIDGKSPIQFAVENHPTSLQQGVKNILKEQDREEQLKDFFKRLITDYDKNMGMIELFSDEFSVSGRGREGFVKIVCPLVETEAKVPNSLIRLYIDEQLSKDLQLTNIHENHKEQAFYTVVELYLDEYTSKDEKAKLQVMYEQLASDLGIDTTKKESALTKFVSDPEECYAKISNLINRGNRDLDIDGNQGLDLKNLYKNIDLETLENLSKVGKKLEEYRPEEKSSSIANNIGIALAVITILPGLILGVMKLISNYQQKQEFKEQQSEALAVTHQLNELGVKNHSHDMHIENEGHKKFTETILNMRLQSKDSPIIGK
jgi:galactitol-specific phosphotransferase system IIB component